MWRCCRTAVIGAVSITLLIDWFSSAELIGDKSIKRHEESTETSHLCDLRVIGDFRWYRHVTHRNVTYGTELVKLLLRQMDHIFRTLDTDGDGVANNIGFFLRDLSIYQNPTRSEYDTDIFESWNPKRFFEEFRDYSFTGICAGLLLTYRPLSFDKRHDMPTIFKTKIASLDQGICSRYVSPSGPFGLLPDYGVYVSNALPVNFMKPDGRVASHLAMVIQTAHQLGHLFGARNDADMKEDQRCRPVLDVSRNYIMAYPLVSGLHERNFRWSPCSQEAFDSFLRGLKAHGRDCLRPCYGPTCSKVVAEEKKFRADTIPEANPPTVVPTTEHTCDVETTEPSEEEGSSSSSPSSVRYKVSLLTGSILAAIAKFVLQGA